MEQAEFTEAVQPLILTLTELADTVHQVAEEQAARDAQRAKELADRVEEGRRAERRQARRMAAIGVLVVIVAAAVGVLLYSAFTGRTILRSVESVTGPAAQARNAAGTRDILARNAVETDCRSRRQQARVPAPDVAPRPPAGLTPAELAAYFERYSCVAQTDPSIYPGVKGEPSRGS